ncbi:MAG: hypothetical protein P4L40_17005, partial [Terracidiphilus sp.]|nr:hypothetical protein [Terracidiphilus sp.]
VKQLAQVAAALEENRKRVAGRDAPERPDSQVEHNLAQLTQELEAAVQARDGFERDLLDASKVCGHSVRICAIVILTMECTCDQALDDARVQLAAKARLVLWCFCTCLCCDF